MCDENGRLSPALTVKIEGQLDGRKYLEANELDLLISLLKIYSSACAEQVLEQHRRKEILGLLSQGLCLNKKKKVVIGGGATLWPAGCCRLPKF